MLPSVDYTLGQLAGAKVFTKLDANSGFWQIPLSKNSALFITFITPFGRFCFNRFPFGISSAPELFQRRMSNLLTGMEGTVCLMDDILIYGSSQEEHDARLCKVLEKLRKSGVTLNREKCVFSVPKIKFLGQVIDQKGIRSDPDKVKAVLQLKEPTNTAEVRRVLGLVNHLGKFIPNLAEKTEPLRKLLSRQNAWIWEYPQATAFQKIKEDLIKSPVLALYTPTGETVVSADASSFGLGAVIQQRQDTGDFKPIAYASRSMTPTEQKYAQIEREALAVTWACERFSDYLYGMRFQVETDHKPLVSLLSSSKRLDELPIRIQRFRLRLMRYNFSISHVSGKKFFTPDTLSRSPVQITTESAHELETATEAYVELIINHLPVTEKRLKDIRDRQTADNTCNQLKRFCIQGWPAKHLLKGPIKKCYPVFTELSVLDGLLLRGNRIIIPELLRDEVIKRLHTGHMGITKTLDRAKAAVWWPGMSSQLKETVENCTVCSKSAAIELNLSFLHLCQVVPGNVSELIFSNGRDNRIFSL